MCDSELVTFININFQFYNYIKRLFMAVKIHTIVILPTNILRKAINNRNDTF